MENLFTDYSNFDQMILKKLYLVFRVVCFFMLFTGIILVLNYCFPFYVVAENILNTDPLIIHISLLTGWILSLWRFTDVNRAKWVIFLILLAAVLPIFFIL